MYDYLIVGAGLFGAVFAQQMTNAGKRCLVIDKRPHIGGNVYTNEQHGIQVHSYGAHIFHTSNKRVWNYVNGYADFNGYINSPVARYQNRLYNLPFNMNTFYQLWGVITPAEAEKKIRDSIADSYTPEPQNLEQQAINLVGREIYEKLIRGYTEKQWGCSCTELPPSIIKRLPVRMTYNNNYFTDTYQGIPIGGYTKLVSRLLDKVEVKCNTDYFSDRSTFDSIAEKTVFTGRIDEYYNCRFGELEYRSLRFETTVEQTENYQGNAVVNYTDLSVPYTRIIEHKHFDYTDSNPVSVITKEYPCKYESGAEPYYPINNDRNNTLYEQYKQLANNERRVIFGGRLGEYKYYDMHNVVAAALECAAKETGSRS